MARRRRLQREREREAKGPVPRYELRPQVLKHIHPAHLLTPVSPVEVPHTRTGWGGLKSTASSSLAQSALEGLCAKGYSYVSWDGQYVVVPSPRVLHLTDALRQPLTLLGKNDRRIYGLMFGKPDDATAEDWTRSHDDAVAALKNAAELLEYQSGGDDVRADKQRKSSKAMNYAALTAGIAMGNSRKVRPLAPIS